MAFCPADCIDNTVTPNAPGDCELKVRKKGIDRFGFYPCSTDLPEPFECAALQALADANELGFTSPLANVNVQDPTFDELVIADCQPTLQNATGRIIEFQDRVAIDLTGAETSPATAAVPYYNYDFWLDKLNKSTRLRLLIIYCDGSVVVPKDDNGAPLEASINPYIAYERIGTGNNAYTIEYVKGTVNFKGDALKFIKPELDNTDAVFNIYDCAGLI